MREERFELSVVTVLDRVRLPVAPLAQTSNHRRLDTMINRAKSAPTNIPINSTKSASV